jgi:chaperonin GroEL (HSP60 family)
MLIDAQGSATITNDGATILREIDVEHPAAKLIIEVSKTQDATCHDGTTSAVVISGELLKKAKDLLEQQIHATIIARGYRQAHLMALEELEVITQKWEDDPALLESIAMTALTGKASEIAGSTIAQICVGAVLATLTHSLEDVKVVALEGGRIEESRLIDGIVLEKEKLHPEMPTSLEDASILLLTTPIEIKDTKMDARLNISDPAQIKAFLAQEEESLKEMVENIITSGADAVFCQKGIDDLAIHYLAKKGIFAVQRIKRSDIERLMRATNGSLVEDVSNIGEFSLGKAGRIFEKRLSDKMTIFISECGGSSVTALLRGATIHTVEETQRAFEDAMGVVSVVYEDRKMLLGAGSSYARLASRLRSRAQEVGGRAQMAIEAYASAIEVIPRTLAENAGLDPVDTLIDLRQMHNEGIMAGVFCPEENDEDGPVASVTSRSPLVIEPERVVSNALSAATEAAIMILRIDDVIATKQGPGSGPPEIGGMM